MSQKGFAALIPLILLTILVLGGFAVFIYSGEFKLLPGRQALNISAPLSSGNPHIEDSGKAVKIQDDRPLKADITNKDEKEYWRKVFSGEIARDLTVYNEIHPASESAQTVNDNIYPFIPKKSRYLTADLFPTQSSPSALPLYIDNVFYTDLFQMINPFDVSSKMHGKIDFEYLARKDYPADILIVYHAIFSGLEPDYKYQLMICQNVLDCYEEVSTKKEITDQFQRRFFMTDNKGEADLTGIFGFNHLQDKMMVVSYDKKYDYSISECGSIKKPCLVTRLPKVLYTAHPSDYFDQISRDRNYKSDPTILAKVIELNYLPYWKDLTFSESEYLKPTYSADVEKGILQPSGEVNVNTYEGQSCEGGLQAILDKSTGALLAYRHINCDN